MSCEKSGFVCWIQKHVIFKLALKYDINSFTDYSATLFVDKCHCVKQFKDCSDYRIKI